MSSSKEAVLVEMNDGLRYKVFPPDASIEGLQMTDVGLYSVTHYKHSLILSYNIRKFFPSCEEIVETCGGVGGDTIVLAQQFKYIATFEPDPVQHWALLNNLTCFSINNCKTYNSFYQATPCDVLYIDPPWGGATYKEQDDITLELGGKAIHKLINLHRQFIKLGFIVKAPLNCKGQVDEFAKMGSVYISKIFHKSRHTYNLIIVRFDQK